MLQWMGGSRRKVATSRKSTQARQKKYFEQRKRQEEHQQTTGVENFSDGMTTSSQHQNNTRSLDILSLLNLSTVVQDCKSRCHSVSENSGGAKVVNYHISKSPPTIQTKRGTPAGRTEFKEARNPSDCELETVYPNKFLSSAADNEKEELTRNGEKTAQLKMETEHQLSVFDLLGDDGPNDSLEESNMHEAHVAFTVEGLGKVESETPVHSPELPGRFSSYGPSFSLKPASEPQPPKNLSHLDAMIQDIDFSLSGSFLDQPFCSKGKVNLFRKPSKKISVARECLQSKSNVGRLKRSFADDEIFNNIEDKSDNIWNAALPDFIDGSFLDVDYDTMCKNRSPKKDLSSTDNWSLGNHEMSSFAFEGPNLQKFRVSEKVNDFDIADSLASHSKRQRSDNDHDFMTLDGTCRYSTGGKYFDASGVTNQSEDGGDSLSLLSEESCSSTAVRSKSTKSSVSKSMARQGGHRRDIRNPVHKWNVGSMFTKDNFHGKRENFHKGKKRNEGGKVTKTCNPRSKNLAYFSNIDFQKGLGSDDCSLLEEGYTSAGRDSGFSSFCPTSGSQKHVSFYPKLWKEDPFGAYPLPELHAKVKSSFERSRHNYLPEIFPRRTASSENLPFCGPYNHADSYGTPVFSTIGPAPSKPSLCTNPREEVRPLDSSPVAGTQGDAGFIRLPLEESLIEEETRSELHLTYCIKLELEKGICIGSNDLSSDSVQPSEASGS
ncbi:uncharacterized protein LOC127797600 isoform X3 [Diospyros lotus]|uniref:uncharacterized protein LOC127797600 isoform X3 n=1 Tax=Diospyros lotus TaxID=55363 RepID=UPI0022572FF7|nr:uncharacterized protein LOC127797600 isoform X3 [Diospyros lotus]